MAYLALIRHTESKWNAKELWTGLSDIFLDEKGILKAQKIAKLIKNCNFDIAYTSSLKRAKETLEIIKNTLGWTLTTIENNSLNEKNYGIYTGRNKWEVKQEVGDDMFLKIRRSWDYQIPKGESLKQVYERVIPYYKKEILPKLVLGQNVLIVAHDNSLRALVKYLENINDQDIVKLELEVGEVDLFEIDKNGKVLSKKILK